jgi:pimeloyl-ACP methyl ester carboxylesterase
MKRRTFLSTAVASTAGIAALGVSPAAADTYVPVVSTRGHFDDDGNHTAGHGWYDYDTEGTVPGIDTSCVGDTTVMVHGWWKKGDSSEAEAAAEEKFEECDRELDGDGYWGEVVGYSWDNDVDSDAGDYGWSTAKEVADKNGYKLAQFLLDYKYDCGSTVRLIGHSLGARVVFSALSVLDDSSYWNDAGYSLQSVHFIGGAVDNEYPTLEYEPGYYGVRNQTDVTYNYYSEEDDTLEWIYNSYEWDQALGETGRESGNTAPSNYADLDVTGQVGNDHSSYLQHCSDEIVSHMS